MTITHHYRTLSLAVALALTALSPNASATTLPPLDSINAVKAVEIGDGFAVAEQFGHQVQDELTPTGFSANHSGGILGGIASGQTIRVAIALKPTASITTQGNSIDLQGNPCTVVTKGRHDPCVGVRATPIAEAMLAIVLLDHYLRHRAQNADVVMPLTPIGGK